MIEHPQIIHFPIALFTTAILTEMLSYFWKKSFFSNVTLFLLILGCLSAFIALKTGQNSAEVYQAVDSLKGLIRQHENAGEWVVRLFTISLAAKIVVKFFKKDLIFIRIIISLIMLGGFLQLYQAGHFGGKLVFDKGVGVKPMQEIIINPSE